LFDKIKMAASLCSCIFLFPVMFFCLIIQSAKHSESGCLTRANEGFVSGLPSPLSLSPGPRPRRPDTQARYKREGV
jgi:hypothetical protein